MGLEKYFEKPAEAPLPPDARRWLPKLRAEGNKTCELLRERDGLVFRPARLVLHVRRDGREVDRDDAFWDLALNDWLVEQRIRAESDENEAERFGLAFNDMFTPTKIRYGDGFFNAVLLHHLREVGFGQVPATKEKLDKIDDPRHPAGVAADDCAQMIDDVINAAALKLTEKLEYPRAQAEEVLASALAYYLDERYSITNNELLFGRRLAS